MTKRKSSKRVPGQPQEQLTNDSEFWGIYLATIIGYSSILRFPYLLKENGGGIFLIPFGLFIFIIGKPQLYLETAIGQYWQKPLTHHYSKVSISYRGIAVTQMLALGTFAVYFMTIMCYSILYLIGSMSDLQLKVQGAGSSKEDVLDRTDRYFFENILGIDYRGLETSGVLGGFNYNMLGVICPKYF